MDREGRIDLVELAHVAGQHGRLAACLADRGRDRLTGLRLAAGNDDVRTVCGQQAAIASPMPRLEPVTRATLPVRSKVVGWLMP